MAAAGSICDAARADEDTLAGIRGIGRRLAAEIVRRRAAVDVEAELRRAEAAGARVVTWLDADYPARLRGLRDAPPVLYVKGAWGGEAGPAVAIVGTRRPSAYGLDVARGLAEIVAAAGVTVVSGLARGIDRAAHEGALASGGRTVGVLACGVDVAYPPEHAILMEAMCERGAVVSEAPMGTPPARQRFPLRNRIISGLAQAVVVVEGGEASGALITARHAAAQRRQVYAVPGSVFARGSRGPHRLLAQGAAPYVDPADLLRRLGVSGAAPARPAEAGPQGLGEDDARVWRVLDHTPAAVDQIAARAGLPAARCAAALGMLEIRGIVRRCAGHRFARRSTFGRADAARTAGGDVWPNHSLS